MKLKVLLTVTCLLLTRAPAQWLETTIYLPDSLGGLLAPRCLAYDSIDNTVYIGGWTGGCVLAIDGTTNQRVARIPTDSAATALCYNSQNNRVYSAHLGTANVAVIDCGADGVRGRWGQVFTFAISRLPLGDRVRSADALSTCHPNRADCGEERGQVLCSSKSRRIAARCCGSGTG